jgi:putative PEP-CTERM system TPR-repeat lipoprotein
MKRLLFALFLWTLSGLAPAAPSQEAIRYYEEALSYFNQEQYQSAEIQLKNALQINPDYLPARLLLGEALLRQGDGASAEKEIRIAQSTGGAPSLTLLSLAKALDQQHKFAALLEEIQVERLPQEQQGEILFLLGRAHLELGQLEEAKKIFEQTLRTPGGSKVLSTVGLAMLELKQKRPQAADSLADRALTYDPKNAEAWHAKGAIAYVRGDLEQAVNHYTRSLELEPNHYTSRISRVSAYIELHRYKEAIKELEALSIASQWDPQIGYFLAVAKRESGDLQGAKDALLDAVNLVNSARYDELREVPHLLLMGGLIYYSNGELEKARKFFSEYINYDSSHLVAHKLLGSTLLALKQPLKAIPVLQRAIDLAPRVPGLHRQLAEAYFQAGQHGKAISSLETADRLAPEQPDTLLRLGLYRLAAKERKKAVQDLEAAYRIDPKSDRIAQSLAAVQLSMRNAKRAEEVLSALVQRRPEDATVANMLGATYLQLQKPEQARQWYTKALAIQPDFRPAIINLAQLDVRENRIASARQALSGLLSKEPENPRLLYELANLEKRAGSMGAAIRLMDKAYEFNREEVFVALRLIDLLLETDNPQRALEIASDLRRREPENSAAHQAIGKVQVALGNQLAARAAFRNAVKFAGFDAQALYQIAQLQLSGDIEDEARWSLQKAVKGDPEYLPALLTLAELEIRFDKLDSAAKLIERLAAIDGDHPTVNSLRGDLAVKKKKYSSAVRHYDKALQSSDDPILALRRYRALIAAGDADTALQDLAAWVDRHPQGIVAKMALAETYHAKGKGEQARVHYEQLLQQGVESAALFNNLANLYVKMKNGDSQALKFAEKAYELAPADPNIIDTLGWVLVRNGQNEKGLGYLRDASTRSPEQAEIRYHLAVALENLGRHRYALDELREALRLSQSFPGSDDARRRLENLEKR